MAKVKIELNRAGVRELLRSEAAGELCRSIADGVAGRAGDGYEVTTHVGQNRVNCSVRAETFAAMRDNMKNNTLLKALK